MKITVNVTAEDFAQPWETHRRCQTCPVSRALSRAIGRPAWASYDRLAMYNENIMESTTESEVPTPCWLTEIMKRIDRGYLVEPFSFEIDMPLDTVPEVGTPAVI